MKALQQEQGEEQQLTQGQQAAVVMAAHAPVSVITGGPGCGKTYVTRMLVDVLTSRDLVVALCAPTGVGRAPRLAAVCSCTAQGRLLGALHPQQRRRERARAWPRSRQ